MPDNRTIPSHTEEKESISPVNNRLNDRPNTCRTLRTICEVFIRSFTPVVGLNRSNRTEVSFTFNGRTP
ncbi:hypothetical protein JOB18_019208 [Solea senegalensis]|uniref:Uncharacterized protein n=1 Tax=Solea senegalensis TaxID=28829 RepID=A0AAV6R613_SOLSE|nr:hypothetical protein JOB18_019208 [Solea senegalensis]